MVDVDSLMDELLESTYTVNGDTFHLITYDKKYRVPEFKRIITNWCTKQESKQVAIMAELQAKVKAYEAIISNSNFSMAITGNKENTTEVSDYAYTSPAMVDERSKQLVDSDMLYASIAKDTYLLTDESDNRDYGMFLIDIRKKIDKATTIIERNE